MFHHGFLLRTVLELSLSWTVMEHTFNPALRSQRQVDGSLNLKPSQSTDSLQDVHGYTEKPYLEKQNKQKSC